MWDGVERRRKRSNAMGEALTLLLEKQKTEAGVELIVLADQHGLILASDGPSDECQRLAAMAPMLAEGRLFGFPEEFRGVRMMCFRVGGMDVYLLARGMASQGTADLVEESASSATRILCS